MGLPELAVVGLVLAAPVLASLRLLIRYMGRKMFDLDPWPEAEEKPAPPLGTEWIARIKSFFNNRKQNKQPNKEQKS